MLELNFNVVQTSTVLVSIEWASYLHLNLVSPPVRVIGLSPLPRALPKVNLAFPGGPVMLK